MGKMRQRAFGGVFVIARWLRKNEDIPVLIGLAALLAAAQSTISPSGTYRPNESKSYLLAITGKSGLLTFAGHQHAILATKWSVEPSIVVPDWKKSSVTLTIPVSSMVIDSPEARRLAGLGAGPGVEDVRRIQERMLGAEVLDAKQHDVLQFTSTSVEPQGESALLLRGQFLMHGQKRQIAVPVRYERAANGELAFSGRFVVKQTDFGIQPESAALGTVHVKDEVQIRFQISLSPPL
jgi:polyisoprenoid-binding protein YceI